MTDLVDITENITDKRQIKLLKAVVETGGSIVESCKVAKVFPMQHYRWLKQSVDYKIAYEEAQMRATETLEAEAIRRASGYDEPLVYKGQKTGEYVRKHSDLLLMFLLKKRNPEYRDNFTQNVGIWGGGDVKIEFNIPRPEDPKKIEAVDAEYKQLEDG